jgi:hypothetical protein
VDAAGNLFISDFYNGHIRRVDTVTGIITTVAGGGSGGDGGAATSAVLASPADTALDGSGNVFIADWFNNRIRRVDATSGIITTVAGNRIAGYSGDGEPATSASLWGDFGGVAVDTHGNLFIADSENERIRRVDAVTGIITTVAGSGQPGKIYIPSGYSGDGGPATSATFNFPVGVALDSQGNLFIVDSYNERIRRVDAVTGIITTVAGNWPAGYAGDGGAATNASLCLCRFGGVALDTQDNLFIADTGNNRVRRVDATTGIITTVAGNGVLGYSGDGGPATSAAVGEPMGVAIDTQGNLFIFGTGTVRRVDAVTGIITKVAGGGPRTAGIGDGGPATSATISPTAHGAVDSQGRLFIADDLDNRIRVVPLPPFVALSATALSFSTQPTGTTSAPQTVTLTNTGLVALTISSIAIGGTNAGDYAQTNACGSSLGAGANCAINVTFTPSGAGSSTATLNITDSAPGSSHGVLLSGTGQNPDFSLVVSGSSSIATVSAGQTATYNLSITPQAGLTGTVTFTCSGAPSEATCIATPTSVNLSGSGAVPITATVSTTAPSETGLRPKPPAGPWTWICVLGLLAAVGLTLRRGPRLTRQRAWAPLGAAMLSLAFWAGCGGGGVANPGTPAGTYTLTVTGSMTLGTTTLQHNLSLTLIVN